MAKNDIKKPDLKMNVNLSPEAERYFRQFPDKLQKARRECVEAAGMIWSDETKDVTRREDHIDTGLYINSIGYRSDPAKPSDPEWDLTQNKDVTELVVGTGSSVTYAAALEKRYGLMAKGLDASTNRIRANMWRIVRRNIDL